MNDQHVFQCHILGNRETHAALRERINSREWWVIPHLNSVAPKLARAMVRECYPAGVGFEAFVLALPGVPIVYVAHKSQMSRSRVADISCIPVPENDDRDVLVAVPEESLELLATFIAADTFTNWLDR